MEEIKRKFGFEIKKINRPFLDTFFEPVKGNRGHNFIYWLAIFDGYFFTVFFLIKLWAVGNWMNLLYAALCFTGASILLGVIWHWAATTKSKCFYRNLTQEDYDKAKPGDVSRGFFGLTIGEFKFCNEEGEYFYEMYGKPDD